MSPASGPRSAGVQGPSAARVPRAGTAVWHRAVLLVLGGASLVAGLDAALVLLGLPAPVGGNAAPALPAAHGTLMVLGFVGTLIALERAVALRRAWGYAAPALLGGGALVQLGPWGAAAWPARLSLLAGTVAFALVYVPLWRRQRDPAVLVQALGAVAAAGAAGLLAAGVAVPAVVPWFAAFLLATIAGERLELARLRIRGPWAEPLLVAVNAALVALCPATLLWPAAGYPLFGLAVLALAAWLVRYDVARATIRATGLPRYVAACLLAGYAWLAVAAGVCLLVPGAPSGAAYDAFLHAVFLGFVMSMVMAHAPVILPAVLRRPLPYRPVMWVPAALLHATLLLRLALGDARGETAAWQWGGAGNVLAVLAFVALAAHSAARARHPHGSRASRALAGGTGAP
ncbi:hypothetical protein SA2016_1645 [Sinomonas atrocyanea]|uniref:NnrS family protein n=1 Tax=Sinomonas atrocyanea TaxID=37927 RepID=A0A127A0B6_9MICC|nr:hypothetical protein [Sinomonas atrocyanea]AMM32321.1 hypothetical protein SA2016_1645 [Sinomonas atrocyanea]GEB66443.1 hypothetical protein SAT01_38910 [Sinomonas atrocyanea]GGG82638.1 hypothetical protein GCM10007172_40210 [Sinomonas atrocyanea]